MEAGVLINLELDPFYWHTPANRTSVSLPDSEELWNKIWENRHDLIGFAHSHPGSGPPSPSHEDITTFAAIESALGRRLTWWIVSSDRTVTVLWRGPEKFDYQLWPTFPSNTYPDCENRFPWIRELRERSK